MYGDNFCKLAHLVPQAERLGEVTTMGMGPPLPRSREMGAYLR
jgi:hypothetical protein